MLFPPRAPLYHMQPFLNVHALTLRGLECTLCFLFSTHVRTTTDVWWAEDGCWADNLTKEDLHYFTATSSADRAGQPHVELTVVFMNSIRGGTGGLLPSPVNKMIHSRVVYHRKPTFGQKSWYISYQINIQIKPAIIFQISSFV